MPQALGLAGLTRFMSQRGWSGVSTVRGCVGELPCLNAWRALGRRTECLSLVGGRKGFGFEFWGRSRRQRRSTLVSGCVLWMDLSNGCSYTQ